ncbi:hypothetical protein ABPG75_013828 [Micractinium tetrahymenae]
MAAPALDYDALRSDWAVFFELLGNDCGIRLRLNMPDTLVIKRGQPVAWFATNKDGYVVQRPVGRSSWEDVRVHLLSCALDESGRYSHFVAVMRGPDGLPKLLTRAALDELCARLDAAAEAAEAAGGVVEGAPCTLQAYITPFLDLRFVTSYTNDGASISCHTFQRRFSRRYLPYRDPAAQAPQPDMLVGAGAAAAPAPGRGAAAAVADAAGGAAGSAAGAMDAEADADLPLLDDAALADSERSLGRTLGPVDPSLKMAARKAAHGLVQYVQKAHLLTLRGLVCEFVRDPTGHLWFTGPLRANWASLIPGRGGEPWANANLTQQPRDEASWPSTAHDEVDAEEGQRVQQPQQEQQQRIEESQQRIQQAAGGSLAGPAAEGRTHIGSPPTAAEAIGRLLPPTALLQPVDRSLEQQEQLAQQNGMPRSPDAAALDGMQRRMRQPQARSPARRSPGQSGAQRERLLTGSPGACGTWQPPHGYTSSPHATASSRGCHPGSPQTRGSPSLITSHLTKELEGLRDELLVKGDLADALACKVGCRSSTAHGT